MMVNIIGTASESTGLQVSAGEDYIISGNSTGIRNVVIGSRPTASGGAPPYTYQWEPATGLSASNVSNPIASPDVTTTYKVTVTDSLGTIVFDSVTVTVAQPIKVDAGAPSKVPIGTPVSIGGAPTATGGLSPYTYRWAPTIGLDDPTVANPICVPTSADQFTYTVTVSDALGAIASDSVVIQATRLDGANIYVDVTNTSGVEDGSQNHPYNTIQEGLDAADNGDTVVVADGNYSGTGNKNLDFKGKAIYLKSKNGPESCVIDCEHNGRGFYFHSGEGHDSVVHGFTIQRGAGWESTLSGAAICCSGASPTIIGNIMQNAVSNDDPYLQYYVTHGGGVYCSSSSAIIQGNIICNNQAGGSGGGIYCSSGSPIIIENTISNNRSIDWPGGGIYCSGVTDVLIANNKISSNQTVPAPDCPGDYVIGGGGGICIENGTGTVVNNVIDNNRVEGYGGGISVIGTQDLLIVSLGIYLRLQMVYCVIIH